jgi:hypothetical protein
MQSYLIENNGLYWFHWYACNDALHTYDYPDARLSRPQSLELLTLVKEHGINCDVKFNSTGYDDKGWASTRIVFDSEVDAMALKLML